jgi:hypothetical protein
MGLLLFVIKTSLLALVVAQVLIYMMRLRARAAHRRALVELQESAKQGGLELLRGKLVVEDRGLPPEAGRPIPKASAASLAARTHWASRDRLWLKGQQPLSVARAETLYLDTDKGRVRVIGEIKVESGSSLLALGTKPLIDKSTWFDIETTLADGDEVSMLGKPRHETAEAMTEGGYREAPVPLIIEPIELTNYVHVVAAAPPKTSLKLRALFRQRAMLVAVVVGAVFGNAVANDYQASVESRDKLCRLTGRCHIDLDVRWEGAKGLRRMLHGFFFTVAAHETADCVRSQVCLNSGECSFVNGQCKATSDDDCRYSINCNHLGTCTAKDGQCIIGKDADCEGGITYSLGYGSAVNGTCIIGKDADCQRTDGCKQAGQCTANGNGACVAAHEEDCVRSEACRNSNFCTLAKTECVRTPLTDQDCQKRPECAQSDRCFARGGVCDLPLSDCVNSSEACQVFGLCGEQCVPRAEQDCLASKRCKTDRACKLIERECAASCETSAVCRQRGACSEGKYGCVVATDADCQKSDRCKSSGHCTADEGVCGMNDADCKKSEECKLSGKCFANPGAGTMCVAKETEDCRRTDACRNQGQCTANGTSCALKSDADCALTARCETNGECERFGNDCVLNDAGCKHLAACKDLGNCGMVNENFLRRCQPKTDADCQESSVCKRFGWCTAVNGHCFVP